MDVTIQLFTRIYHVHWIDVICHTGYSASTIFFYICFDMHRTFWRWTHSGGVNVAVWIFREYSFIVGFIWLDKIQCGVFLGVRNRVSHRSEFDLKRIVGKSSRIQCLRKTTTDTKRYSVVYLLLINQNGFF